MTGGLFLSPGGDQPIGVRHASLPVLRPRCHRHYVKRRWPSTGLVPCPFGLAICEVFFLAETAGGLRKNDPPTTPTLGKEPLSFSLRSQKPVTGVTSAPNLALASEKIEPSFKIGINLGGYKPLTLTDCTAWQSLSEFSAIIKKLSLKHIPNKAS